ncbi:uncharacterized protein LOC131430560 [Malaya genurostris]|uniref:uncharacterized protein LOC131430497 n=1 Tax=Malaya genurostris TaxID=325434 RepID=UPI0026F3FA78|nr:uncharacterized protein LOC131430497 [Malaya genurostris]XP_058451610.1 uncharacterized protein LOC131430560 [Malaya genurostris]
MYKFHWKIMDESELEPVTENILVRLEDILEYVGDSVRPIREGLAVLSANHIVCIGYTGRSGAHVLVKGYVLQSSHPGGIPHEVSLKICENHPLWDLNCSCKAGTRRCKHIVACLLRINQFKRLEHISCTDAVQAWGCSKIEKISLWGAKPIADLCCVRHRKLIVCSDVSMKETLLSDALMKILAVSPQSAISKHMIGRHTNVIDFRTGISSNTCTNNGAYCTEQELNATLFGENQIKKSSEKYYFDQSNQNFYEKFVCVTKQQILNIAMETCAQNNKTWKAQRSLRITASSY